MRPIFLLLVILSGATYTRAQTQGWFTYDTSNSAIPSDMVTAVETDAQNAVWVGTVNGLAKFEDFFNWTVWNTGNSALPDNWITCLRRDPAGRMWAGTLSGGLCVLNGSNITTYHTLNSPLTSNRITSVNFEGGTAWITTDGGGLFRFDGTAWQNYNSNNSGFEIDICYDVDIDGAGNKWIGTLSGGLLRLSGSIITAFDPTDSDLPFPFVRSVAVENDTSIWVGMGFTDHDSALVRFNGTAFTVYSDTRVPGIAFRNIWDILVTPQGDKWFCTNDLDHGVVNYNDTTFREYNSFNSGLPYNRVYGVAKDTGNVWFATMRGLAVFNRNNAFLPVAEEQTLWAAQPYPNPATDRIRLVMQPQVYQARVTLFAADGKRVWERQANDLAGMLEIPVDGLRNGFYFGAVQARGRTDYFKFIKQ